MKASLQNNITPPEPVFAIVVGEHSGDTLGAGLMQQLKLSHPTLAESDRDSLMQLTQEKQNGKPVYQGFIDDLTDGRYYVQVESPEQSWRLRNELYMAQGETSALK